MDFEGPNDKIREIEDVIDFQKASGSYNTSNVDYDNLKSLNQIQYETNNVLQEDTRSFNRNFNVKKRQRRHWKCKNTDLISWPSDSDITVLRFKSSPHGTTDLNSINNSLISGDGEHLGRNSSMVNLATVIGVTKSASKSDEENYLLALSSWDPGDKPSTQKIVTKTRHRSQVKLEHVVKTNSLSSEIGEKKSVRFAHSHISVEPQSPTSRLAKFLRLYFCPCSSCLYQMESRQQDKEDKYVVQEIINGIK